MAFKMNKPVFKQTDPPSDKVDLGYSTENRQYDEKGVGITSGPEWYSNAEKIDYNSLSDKQKKAIGAFSQDRTGIEDRVYSSNGNLYFDQGTYWEDEQQQEEPLLIQSNWNNTSNNTSIDEPTIDAKSVDDSLNDFGARTFKIDGLRAEHTFSPSNPYIKDIKGNKITDRNILTPARRWERSNSTIQERKEGNRFGDNG